MCNKAVDTCPFVFDFPLDWYRTQEICNKIVSKKPFKLKYCLDRSRTQEMCYEVVDVWCQYKHFLPDWFVTNKMLKELDNAAFCSNDMVFVDADSNFVTFFRDVIDLNSINIDNMNLHDDNFDENDPKTIIYSRLMAWCKRYK